MFDVDMFVESLLDSLGTGLQGSRGSEQFSTSRRQHCAVQEESKYLPEPPIACCNQVFTWGSVYL